MKSFFLKAVAALSLASFTYASNHRLQISFYKHPSQFQGRIVHLSDTHIPYSGFKLKRLVREIEKVNPDVILITGDLLDRTAQSHDLHYASEFVSKLSQIAPVYACLGNHDARFKEHYQQMDLNLVEGAMVTHINQQKVEMIGVHPGHKKRIETNPNSLSIILDHFPQSPEVNLPQFDTVQFSGHAHGGQFRFNNRGLFAPEQGFKPKYTKGYYPMGLFVSAGLGASQVPLRLNNPNHVIVVDFVYNNVGGILQNE